ncbi:hypothetical protein B0H17DRAFT_1078116 [Mycena rosella]|uniref:Uncharacterized protein n=1 Tax=Mycena rosella TaxID=1033263 RepID=A0AAD7D874_MYCRO|nr:hypothetical protein B0H17DRAFT_1078116 [Mycena rosella]
MWGFPASWYLHTCRKTRSCVGSPTRANEKLRAGARASLALRLSITSNKQSSRRPNMVASLPLIRPIGTEEERFQLLNILPFTTSSRQSFCRVDLNSLSTHFPSERQCIYRRRTGGPQFRRPKYTFRTAAALGGKSGNSKSLRLCRRTWYSQFNTESPSRIYCRGQRVSLGLVSHPLGRNAQSQVEAIEKAWQWGSRLSIFKVVLRGHKPTLSTTHGTASAASYDSPSPHQTPQVDTHVSRFKFQ